MALVSKTSGRNPLQVQVLYPPPSYEIDLFLIWYILHKYEYIGLSRYISLQLLFNLLKNMEKCPSCGHDKHEGGKCASCECGS